MYLRFKPAWILLILIFALVACGGDDDESDSGSPTLPPLEANLTSSPGATASVSGFVIEPSPTTVGLVPTNTPFSIAPPSGGNTNLPNAIAITSPASGTQVLGNITVRGAASHPNFSQYALEYGPNPNPDNLWYPITSVPITTPVLNGNPLGAWNTTTVPDGNYLIRLHVWFNTGAQDVSQQVGVTVNNRGIQNTGPNNNPSIANIPPVVLNRGQSVTLALGITDPNNDPVSYIAQVANPSISTITPAGASSITVNGIAQGVTNVTIRVNDGRGGTASTSFSVTVNEPVARNNPPSLSPIASQTLNVGQEVVFTVNASDPDPGDSVTLTSASNNSGIAQGFFNQNVLSLQGKVQGTTNIVVTARDTTGLTSSVTFSVTVINPVQNNNPPTVSAVGNQTVEANTALDVNVNISDPDNDPLTITANSNNDGVVSALMLNSSTVQLNGVAAGSAEVTIVANDGRGGVSNTSFLVNVTAPVNNPPTVSDFQDITIVLEDGAQNVAVTVTDNDSNDITITAAAVNAAVATATYDGANVVVTPQGAGSTLLNVEVNDNDGNVVPKSFTVTVESPVNNPPTIAAINDVTLTEGDPSVPVPLNVTDPEGDDLTITVTPADSNVANASYSADTGLISIEPLGVGTTAINISVEDGTNDAVTASFNVIVEAVVVNSPPTISPVGDLTLQEGGNEQTVNLIVTDDDGDALTINVAPVDSNVASTSFDPNTTTITITPGTVGTTQVDISVEDGTNPAVTTSFNVTVEPVVVANDPPTIDAIGDLTLQEGGNPQSVAVNANDPDGDALTIAAAAVDGNVATASFDANTNSINVTPIAAGSTQVDVSVDDGNNPAVTTSFTVTVEAVVVVNNPPALDPISNITLQEGGNPQSVAVNATDPDGDALTIAAAAVDGNVATASFDANTNSINVAPIAAGSTQVNVSVDDGNNPAVTTSFTVTVEAVVVVNNPPTIDPISNITLQEGGNPQSVAVNANDPDGDALTIAAAAVDGNVATASFDANTNSINVTPIAAGSTQVNVSVDDGNNPAVTTSFTVTVEAVVVVNNPPTIGAIGNVTITEGAPPLSVALALSDPESDPLTVTASAVDGAIATASYDGNTTSVIVTPVAAGSTQVNVSVDDGNNPAVTTSFTVTVEAVVVVNNPPTIDPLGDVTLGVGDAPIQIPVVTSDPEGDILTITAASVDGNVATATYEDATNNINVAPVGVGSTQVNVDVNDNNGNSVQASFTVTVEDVQPPGFDVTAFPEIPSVNGNLPYNAGRNFVFSVAGDQIVANGDILDPIAGGVTNFGNFGGLEGIVNFFNVEARDGATSFNVASFATGNDWTIDNLFAAPLADAACAGAAPLACELQFTQPSVVFIAFTPSNATALPPDLFRSNLDQAIQTALDAGVIPVVATLPDDGSVAPNTLSQYNEIIVNSANNSGVPLWNLYVTMEGASNGVYAVAGGGPTDFSDGALAGGINRQNLAMLRVLEAVRNTFP